MSHRARSSALPCLLAGSALVLLSCSVVTLPPHHESPGRHVVRELTADGSWVQRAVVYHRGPADELDLGTSLLPSPDHARGASGPHWKINGTPAGECRADVLCRFPLSGATRASFDSAAGTSASSSTLDVEEKLSNGKWKWRQTVVVVQGQPVDLGADLPASADHSTGSGTHWRVGPSPGTEDATTHALSRFPMEPSPGGSEATQAPLADGSLGSRGNVSQAPSSSESAGGTTATATWVLVEEKLANGSWLLRATVLVVPGQKIDLGADVPPSADHSTDSGDHWLVGGSPGTEATGTHALSRFPMEPSPGSPVEIKELLADGTWLSHGTVTPPAGGSIDLGVDLPAHANHAKTSPAPHWKVGNSPGTEITATHALSRFPMEPTPGQSLEIEELLDDGTWLSHGSVVPGPGGVIDLHGSIPASKNHATVAGVHWQVGGSPGTEDATTHALSRFPMEPAPGEPVEVKELLDDGTWLSHGTVAADAAGEIDLGGDLPASPRHATGSGTHWLVGRVPGVEDARTHALKQFPLRRGPG